MTDRYEIAMQTTQASPARPAARHAAIRARLDANQSQASRLAGRLPPPVQRAARRLADSVAEGHFRRHPRALGVALGAGSTRLATGARWVAGIDTARRRWESDLAASLRADEPPMLLTDLDATDLCARRRRAAWRTLAAIVPAGSILLVQVALRDLVGLVRDPQALRRQHPRLRLDRLHRPLPQAGAGWAAWSLLYEILHGQPALALCEIGIDP